MAKTIWASYEKTMLKRLISPAKIQEFLDNLPYSSDSFSRSPKRVLHDKTAHCFDGALFAAAALRFIGYPPLLADLRANDNDDDHIIAIYRMHGYIGAVAKSNFTGLRFREPIFKNIRELALSYFEQYYNLNGEKTLREYSAPLDLCKFDYLKWMTDDKNMEKITEILSYKLDTMRHYPIATPKIIKNLAKVDKRSYDAGILGLNMAGVYKPK